jgi:hypothetical protein
MPVNVHARSFPATIRETSSRRNRHLRHRNSHNGDDHGCKITRLPGHFPVVRLETPAEPLHEHFTPPRPKPPKIENRHQQPPERIWRAFIKGCPRHRAPTQTHPPNVNQLTIDIIGYILSQMGANLPTRRWGQKAISINAGLREWRWCGRSGQRCDCTDSPLPSDLCDPHPWGVGDERWPFCTVFGLLVIGRET